jgi:hypothetical protein
MSLKYEVLNYYDLARYIIYFSHGQYHRINGPSVLWPDGDHRYYQYGFLHRTIGPASKIRNEYAYYLRGKQYVPKI